MDDADVGDMMPPSEEHSVIDCLGDGNSSSEFNCSDYGAAFAPVVNNVLLAKIITLCIMIIMSTIGNVATVMITCRLRRRRKSTVTLLVLNLAIADLLVTYTHMLPHAIWYSVVVWYGGSVMCKLVKFFSSFGLFLSSFLTVDISLDHCLAVFYPLAKIERPRNAKMMIFFSYFIAFIFSIPQVALFYAEMAPPGYFTVEVHQCVTIPQMIGLPESVYTTIVLFIQVIAPLVIMCAAYTAIFCKIKSESSKGVSINDNDTNVSQNQKARSRLFMRAQHRTLRMIVTIFLAFVINWTPYVLAAMVYAWHISDHPGNTVGVVFEVAFLFGLSNSCFNPIVYGCCNLHYFDNLCASCCAVIIGRPDSSQCGTDHKTSTYTMRWSMKSSPGAKQGYGHHHPHHNNSVNRAGANSHGSNSSQWIKGRVMTDGVASSSTHMIVS